MCLVDQLFPTYFLKRMHVALKLKYPDLVNRRRVLMQQDNTPNQTSRLTENKIQEIQGIELIKHLAFSPDLSPSDYHIFSQWRIFL